MHELSVVQAFAQLAESYASQYPDEKVAYVTLQIGEMTGVIPKYVRSYYPDVVAGTILEGSEVRIEEEPALAFCRDCGNTFQPKQRNDPCTRCLGLNYEIIEGDKILLKDIGFVVTDEEMAEGQDG